MLQSGARQDGSILSSCTGSQNWAEGGAVKCAATTGASWLLLDFQLSAHKSSCRWKNLYVFECVQQCPSPLHTHTYSHTLKNKPCAGSPDGSGSGADEITACCLLCEEHVVSVSSVSSLKTVLILWRSGLSLLLLFGLGLNLIHLTILSPPLMNSSVAV